jgi:hypothetical protein
MMRKRPVGGSGVAETVLCDSGEPEPPAPTGDLADLSSTSPLDRNPPISTDTGGIPDKVRLTLRISGRGGSPEFCLKKGKSLDLYICEKANSNPKGEQRSSP